MNRNNVQIGDKFTVMSKFYKVLELPTNVKGNQRVAQDKEIARWFDLKPTGTNKRAKNEFYVADIRSIPLDKEDGRINNGENKYIDDLIPLLHDYISRVGEQYTTMRKLLIGLNLIKQDYSRIFDETNKLANEITEITDIKVTTRTIEDFYNSIHRTMSTSVRNSLNKLYNQGKIEYKTITYVTYEDDEEVYKATEEDLKIIEENEIFALEHFVELGIIKEPKKNSFMNFANKRKYNKYLGGCLLEDGITKVWQMIYFKPITKEILSADDKENLSKDLRHKFAKTTETRMINIKWLPQKLATGFGVGMSWGEINPSLYNYLYDEMHNQYGWFKMQEVIKYMFMLQDNTKEKWVDNLNDEIKELYECGLYTIDDLLPKGVQA